MPKLLRLVLAICIATTLHFTATSQSLSGSKYSEFVVCRVKIGQEQQDLIITRQKTIDELLMSVNKLDYK